MWKPITTVLTLGVLVVASFWGATVLFGPKQPKIQSITSPQPIEQPKQAYAAPQVETVTSIDGQKKLILTESQSEANTTYTIAATDENGSQTMSYIKIVSLGSSFSAPANAWSPDDKYVYINGTTNNKPEVFVLRADGQPFADGQQALDVTSLFIAKDNGYKLDEVTGWAAPGLLIVETTKDGALGLSFWFEIPSKSFIQLSRHQ